VANDIVIVFISVIGAWATVPIETFLHLHQMVM